MSNQALKAISAADKVLSLVEDGLSGLELTIKRWPAEFRVIIWETVASIATRRAEAARKSS